MCVGGCRAKTNESERWDADQQPTRSPAISLCRTPHPEGVGERQKEKGGRPMSRHQSSHNTTDTNPGSVPLAPDDHKSKPAGKTGRKPNTEVKKPQPHSADQTAQWWVGTGTKHVYQHSTNYCTHITEELGCAGTGIEP